MIVDEFENLNLGRIAIFIDEANVYHSQKDLHWKIDYIKLRNYFNLKSDLISINFYTSFVKENIE